MDYYQAYQNKDELADVRRQMIEYAMEKGMRSAAREFGASVKTVRKWVKRFREGSHPDLL